MINNVILVGRVCDEPKLVVFESGHKLVNFVLAIQKPFRNENNEYETDFIPIQAWTSIGEIIKDYVGKGSIIGLKCRISSRTIDVNDVKVKSVEVIAERVSFISLNQKPDSKKNTESLIINEEEDLEIPIEEIEKKSKKSVKKEN